MNSNGSIGADESAAGGAGGADDAVSPHQLAAELTMVVACEGAEHRLRWRRGDIELLDHPELEAELALVAFGGAEPPCITHHQLWADAIADGGFLAEWVDDVRLTPSWFSWLAMALERMRSEGFHEFLRGLPPARARRMGEFLHHFPVSWIDRAAATVGRSAFEGDGVDCDQAPGLLLEAVANRLRRAFVDSVGGRQLAVGAAALVPLTLSVSTGERTAISGALVGPGRGVRIAVDGSWLHRVWATDAAVIDGHLVLSLTDDRENRYRAEIVCWSAAEDGPPQPTIEQRAAIFADDRWRLL